jgi:hypothetical protein
MDMLKLTFIPWDTLAICGDKVELVKKTIQEMKKEFGGNAVIEEQAAILLQNEPKEIEWLIAIHSDKELHQAEKDDRICCVVLTNVLDSYERLEQIERLTRSLRRPMDAICCCFQDALQRDSFARYAAQFPRLQFRFCIEDIPAWREELWLKYGKASLIRKQLTAGAIISNQVLAYLGQQKVINDNQTLSP